MSRQSTLPNSPLFPKLQNQVTAKTTCNWELHTLPLKQVSFIFFKMLKNSLANFHPTLNFFFIPSTMYAIHNLEAHLIHEIIITITLQEDNYCYVEVEYFLSTGVLAIGLIFGGDRLDILLVLCLWRHFPNSPFL